MDDLNQPEVHDYVPSETKPASGSNSDLTSLLSSAIAMADRRELYCKSMKPCPACGTNQVQLVDWTVTAEWKCRKCRHKWSGT